MKTISSSTPQLDIRISFLLRTTYSRPNGEHPIVLRIIYRGQRRDIMTGVNCSQNEWIAKLGRVKMESKNSGIINNQIEMINRKTRDCFDSLKYSSIEFSLDELIDKIRGREPAPETLMEYMHNKLQELEDRIGVDLSKTTFFKYRRTKNYLEEFLAARRNTRNIPVSKVDGEFINQFFLYMRKHKNNSHNSALALLNCLRTILQQPVKNGIIKSNPFQQYPLTKKPVYGDYLTLDEINSIKKLENLSPALDRYRDIFLFACYTGLSYSDIKDLSSIDFIKDPDGSLHIQKQRNKTGVISLIPLLPVAEEILLKYSTTPDCRDFIWDISSNQKCNINIKIIAQKAGITKPVFMHLARHTFATTVTLAHGVPLESVSKMLGHSTIKHTQIYAKIIGAKVKADMEKIKELFR